MYFLKVVLISFCVEVFCHGLWPGCLCPAQKIEYVNSFLVHLLRLSRHFTERKFNWNSSNSLDSTSSTFIHLHASISLSILCHILSSEIIFIHFRCSSHVLPQHKMQQDQWQKQRGIFMDFLCKVFV